MLRFLLLDVRVLYHVEELTWIVTPVVIAFPAFEICVGGYSFNLFAAVLAVSPVIAAADPLGGAAIREAAHMMRRDLELAIGTG
jgi:hypothetical protein